MFKGRSRRQRHEMNNRLRALSLAYAAGAVGALINSLVAWLFGLLGITAAVGVNLAPTLDPGWLYSRIVWGGLWGLLFLIPLCPAAPFLRGLVFGIPPTVVQLFVIFPFKTGKGIMGLDLGTLTPLLVFVFNAIWGVVASFWWQRAAIR